jgi:hypothetical protein
VQTFASKKLCGFCEVPKKSRKLENREVCATSLFRVNPAGAITGFCIAASNVFHGFLWIPPSR